MTRRLIHPISYYFLALFFFFSRAGGAATSALLADRVVIALANFFLACTVLLLPYLMIRIRTGVVFSRLVGAFEYASIVACVFVGTINAVAIITISELDALVLNIIHILYLGASIFIVMVSAKRLVEVDDFPIRIPIFREIILMFTVMMSLVLYPYIYFITREKAGTPTI